jgi:hypothetical protein
MADMTGRLCKRRPLPLLHGPRGLDDWTTGIPPKTPLTISPNAPAVHRGRAAKPADMEFCWRGAGRGQP